VKKIIVAGGVVLALVTSCANRPPNVGALPSTTSTSTSTSVTASMTTTGAALNEENPVGNIDIADLTGPTQTFTYGKLEVVIPKKLTDPKVDPTEFLREVMAVQAGLLTLPTDSAGWQACLRVLDEAGPNHTGFSDGQATYHDQIQEDIDQSGWAGDGTQMFVNIYDTASKPVSGKLSSETYDNGGTGMTVVTVDDVGKPYNAVDDRIQHVLR